MMAIIRQFIVFCGVGSINTIVGLGIILLLSEGMGVQYMLANFIGYAVGLCLGFWLHKTVTFKEASPNQSTRQQMVWFLIVFAVAYTIQLGFLRLAVGEWGWGNAVSQVLACGVYVAISYTGSRYRVFASNCRKSK